MISSLSRHLPRTTAAAAFKCTRPSVSTTSSTLYSQPIFSQRAHLSSTPPSDDNDTNSLTRDAIADIVSSEYGLGKAESKRILTTVFDTIMESVTKKETVSITNFGKFESLDIPAREYTNPQDPTGAKVSKPPTSRVKFHVFKHFKNCVAEGKLK